MIKVTQTYVKYDPSGIPSNFGKTYILYIPDNGPLGDKFNMGPSSTGVKFPPQAAERFAFKRDAEKVLTAFLKYCKAKIDDIKHNHVGHKNSGFSSNRLEKDPSYSLWG